MNLDFIRTDHIGQKLVIICGIVLCLLSNAFASETDRTLPYHTIVGEYTTLKDALNAQATLKKKGVNVKVQKYQFYISVERIQIGPYTRRRHAEKIVKNLSKRNIDNAIIRDKNGYYISLGVYKYRTNLQKKHYQISSLGFTNIHVVTSRMRKYRYRLLIKSKKTGNKYSAKKGHRNVTASSTGDETTSSIEKMMIDENRLFRSRYDADAEVHRLMKLGVKAEIITKDERVILDSVQLRPYARWADAKNIARRIKRMGEEAQVISDYQQRGFAVSAGAFAEKENVSRVVNMLRDKGGFKNIYIVPINSLITRYAVAIVEPTPHPQLTQRPQKKEQHSEETVLVFGKPQDQQSIPQYATDSDEKNVSNIDVERLRVELGWLTNKDSNVQSSNYVSSIINANWRPYDNWEFQLAARLDAYLQYGVPEFRDIEMDYGESFVRYRGEKMRVTLGAQKIIYGRIDEVPPTDNLSTRDLRRYILDDLEDRRLPSPSLRMEWYSGMYKTDILWLPVFRPAALPDQNSIWSPVDRQRGHILGTTPSPLLAPLVRFGTYVYDDGGSGGGGVRFSRNGQDIDYSLTIQRARRSIPYYELNPEVRNVLVSTGDPNMALNSSAPTFIGHHPWTWVLGGDLGFVSGGYTWRFEAAWLDSVPVTKSDLSFSTAQAIDFAMGMEFFPGDNNARMTTQVSAYYILDTDDILDDSHYSINGEFENVSGHSRWRQRLRYSVGINKKDIYLNPEFAYIGFEPHEFYLGYHYFDGEDDTPNGFHKNHDLIVLGWRTRF